MGYDLFGRSPHLEILARNIYRRLQSFEVIGRLKRRFRDNSSPPIEQSIPQLLEHFEQLRLHDTRVVVIHSSYTALSGLCSSPDALYATLKEWWLDRGVTMVMPAFPVWPRYQEGETELVYRKRKCRIWTGVLPFVMLRDPDAVVSDHPLNSVVAVGPLAREIIAGNIDGETPLPCGPSSSWKHCVDHNALVLGLGIDLTHSLTMVHVSEDCNTDRWPRKDWYCVRRFKVVDEFGTASTIAVKQRKSIWGERHFAERKLARDLVCNGLLKRHQIGGVNFELIESGPLYQFLSQRIETGYPYYWI